MLDDRSYMQSGAFRTQRPVTFVLMIINAAIFVVQSLLEMWQRPIFNWYFEHFALSVAGLKSGYIWQLVTFQFMHGGLLHLIVNLIVIYFFGRAIEEAVGRNHFLKLYLGCGVIGGLLQVIFAALFPQYFGGSVVGASAGAFGLVAAFATMFPEHLLTLLLFFVIPVSMRARTLFWLSLGIAVFGIIVPMGNVAEAAHLGGLLAGVAYIKWVVTGAITMQWPRLRFPSTRPSRHGADRAARRSFWQQPKPTEDLDLGSTEFISRDVDPILDKISAHGIQSLTERERRILEAARARMAKR